MSAPGPHPLDALHDAIGGRLDDRGRAELDAHLATCESCRREFEILSRLQAQMGTALRLEEDEEMPADLEARLRQSLDEEDRRQATGAAGLAPARSRSPWRWAGWAAAAAVLALTIVWSERRPSVPAPAQVAADFRQYAAGTLPVDLVTAETAALERQLAGADLGFAVRVFDFGMMDFQLAGGGVHQVSGQRSALFAYRGPDSLRLLCQMYEGQVGALPPPAERRTNDGIEFLVYRDGDVTVVFWQEGDVACALAANGDPEAAVRLAFAKAVKV